MYNLFRRLFSPCCPGRSSDTAVDLPPAPAAGDDTAAPSKMPQDVFAAKFINYLHHTQVSDFFTEARSRYPRANLAMLRYSSTARPTKGPETLLLTFSYSETDNRIKHFRWRFTVDNQSRNYQFSGRDIADDRPATKEGDDILLPIENESKGEELVSFITRICSIHNLRLLNKEQLFLEKLAADSVLLLGLKQKLVFILRSRNFIAELLRYAPYLQEKMERVQICSVTQNPNKLPEFYRCAVVLHLVISTDSSEQAGVFNPAKALAIECVLTEKDFDSWFASLQAAHRIDDGTNYTAGAALTS